MARGPVRFEADPLEFKADRHETAAPDSAEQLPRNRPWLPKLENQPRSERTPTQEQERHR